MTQRQLAGDRFSAAYISAVESGHAFPSVPSLQFIAERLGVAPHVFFEGDEDGELAALPVGMRRAWLADGRIYVELSDGRAVGLPIAWSQKLRSARLDQFDAWTIAKGGRVIRWPEVGEEIGIEDFLGVRIVRRSKAESAASSDATTPG